MSYTNYKILAQEDGGYSNAKTIPGHEQSLLLMMCDNLAYLLNTEYQLENEYFMIANTDSHRIEIVGCNFDDNSKKADKGDIAILATEMLGAFDYVLEGREGVEMPIEPAISPVEGAETFAISYKDFGLFFSGIYKLCNIHGFMEIPPNADDRLKERWIGNTGFKSPPIPFHHIRETLTAQINGQNAPPPPYKRPKQEDENLTLYRNVAVITDVDENGEPHDISAVDEFGNYFNEPIMQLAENLSQTLQVAMAGYEGTHDELQVTLNMAELSMNVCMLGPDEIDENGNLVNEEEIDTVATTEQREALKEVAEELEGAFRALNPDLYPDPHKEDEVFTHITDTEFNASPYSIIYDDGENVMGLHFNLVHLNAVIDGIERLSSEHDLYHYEHGGQDTLDDQELQEKLEFAGRLDIWHKWYSQKAPDLPFSFQTIRENAETYAADIKPIAESSLAKLEVERTPPQTAVKTPVNKNHIPQNSLFDNIIVYPSAVDDLSGEYGIPVNNNPNHYQNWAYRVLANLSYIMDIQYGIERNSTIAVMPEPEEIRIYGYDITNNNSEPDQERLERLIHDLGEISIKINDPEHPKDIFRTITDEDNLHYGFVFDMGYMEEAITIIESLAELHGIKHTAAITRNKMSDVDLIEKCMQSKQVTALKSWHQVVCPELPFSFGQIRFDMSNDVVIEAEEHELNMIN